jgi:uroporphyrinogen-III synthase
MKGFDNGIIIILSGRTAQSFKDEVKKLTLERHCENKFVFLLSKKIKNELSGLKFRETFISKKPTEISLIKEIKNFQIRRYEVG